MQLFPKVSRFLESNIKVRLLYCALISGSANKDLVSPCFDVLFLVLYYTLAILNTLLTSSETILVAHLWRFPVPKAPNK